MKTEPFATIRVHRARRYYARLRLLQIVVDGEVQGAVAYGGIESVEVEPGRHSVQAKQDWARSRPLMIDVAPGETVDLTFDITVRGWKLLLIIPYFLLWGRDILVVRAGGLEHQPGP